MLIQKLEFWGKHISIQQMQYTRDNSIHLVHLRFQTLQKHNTQKRKQNKKTELIIMSILRNSHLHYISLWTFSSNYQVIRKVIFQAFQAEWFEFSLLPSLFQLCGEGPFLFQKDSPGLHEDLNAFGVNYSLMLVNRLFSKV